MRKYNCFISLCLICLVSCQDTQESRITSLITNYVNDSLQSVTHIYITSIDSLFDDMYNDTTILDAYTEYNKLAPRITEGRALATILSRQYVKEHGSTQDLQDNTQFSSLIGDIAMAQTIVNIGKENVITELSKLNEEFYGWRVEANLDSFNDTANQNSQYLFFIDPAYKRVFRCYDLSACNMTDIADYVEMCMNSYIEQ